jgi:hypothetical protein
MAVVWPPTLPSAPLIEGYSETTPQIVRRSAMDAGPPKVRRSYTANVSEIACRYAMTRAQVDTFDAFYFGPAGGGSIVFEWEHPRRHVTVNARFREPRPTYTNGGHPEDVWFVDIALEVLPPGMALAAVSAA